MGAQIRITTSGLSVLDRDCGEPVTLEWAGVREIVVFKRDLITFDEICIAFRCGVPDQWVEISESDDGFTHILRELKRQFPSIPEDWYIDVMFPPFEPSEQVLFRTGET